MHSEELNQYILDHINEEEAILKELNRETHVRTLQPRMLSGHLQGQILKMLCTMINPLNVLEIGAFTGYSAISMAFGMHRENSHLDTIEINDESEEFIQSYFDKAGLSEKITLHIGSAIDIMPSLNKKYDLIFMDGDKREYTKYLDLSLEMLNPGGYILADNILWDGKVVKPVAAKDAYTRNIIEFNKRVKEDPNLEKVIFPLRDGLFLIRKK